jgi:hypothetical protein
MLLCVSHVFTQELLRPGFTRLSLAYYNSPAEIDHILQAIHFIASKGFLFLPQYRMNHITGEWKHTTRATRFPERKWLGSFDLRTAVSVTSKSVTTVTENGSVSATTAADSTIDDDDARDALLLTAIQVQKVT